MVLFCSSFQLAFFNIPLMAYLCWSLVQRCFGHNFKSHLHQGKYLKIIPVHLLMLLLYIWQICSCYFLHMTYGTLAFFFSPLRTWLTLLTPVLIYHVWTLNSKELGTFTTQLKSHLSSWRPCLTIHLGSPGLCSSSRLKASIGGRLQKLLLLGCLGVAGGITHYWFLQNGLQKSLTIMPWFLPSSRRQRVDLLLWRESPISRPTGQGLGMYGRIWRPVWFQDYLK